MSSRQLTRRLDICVCTFRRPALEATLRSLGEVRLPEGIEVGIVVADNDDVPSAKVLVERMAAEHPLPIRYIHCPARNISLARNACLDFGDAELIAFIDDDETATPEWLVELVAAIDAKRADVILGPVRAHYEPAAPRWMKDGDFHSTLPVRAGGRIRTGYTCNVLIKTSAASVAGRRFSLARGQTGGEDTTFFAEVTDAGGVIEYTPAAWLEEVVPAARASFDWLARRRFRMGQTHGHLIAARAQGSRRLLEIGIASTKVAFCAAAALLAAMRPVSRNRNILRGTLHVGVVAGLIGMRELRQYGGTNAMEGARNAT